jgi:hypothetical protein
VIVRYCYTIWEADLRKAELYVCFEVKVIVTCMFDKTSKYEGNAEDYGIEG